jgi:Flp pilus assembly protein TadD
MRSADLARTAAALSTSLLIAACAVPGSKPAPAPTAAPAATPATAVEPAPVTPAVQRAYDSARAAMAAGQSAEAERAFVALTKSNPELAGPWANLGVLHRNAGRTADAVSALEKAAKLAPGNAEIANQLGVAYRMAGQFKQAKASYERSITLDPAYAAAVLNLGILYDLYLWDGARALELYDRYLLMTPGDAQVQRWVTDLKNRAGKSAAVPRKEPG